MSGCVAVSLARCGQLDAAMFSIVAGAVFDFLDGMSARLLNVSSPIGKELDSLADVVTFGVAPATMVFFELSVMDYPASIEGARPWLPFTAYIMTAFSALRLANFNIDERQTTSFIGLPTPANALFWGSLLTGGKGILECPGHVIPGMPAAAMLPTLLVLAAVSCWLMNAEFPMFALKFKHYRWRGNEVRYVFLISCVPLAVVFGKASLAVIIAWYIVLSAYDSHNKTRRQ